MSDSTLDLMRRIGRLELRVRRLVDSALVGAYRSAFKGRGVTFDGVRPYEPGDDVRSMDWNVSARAGEPYIKQYVEDRELTVMVVVDDSASMRFGSQTVNKRERAAELTAAVSMLALRGGDRVGVLVAGDEVRAYLPPRRGRGHVLRAIKMVSAPTHSHRLDIAGALRTVSRLMPQRGVVFVVSDLLGDASEFTRPLGWLGRRHDVVCAVVDDPLERWLPEAGLLAMEDMETGRQAWVDTSDTGWREVFLAKIVERRAARELAIGRAGASRLLLSTDGDVMTALARFLRERARTAR